MAVEMPNVENLPYHPDKLPTNTKDLVEALAKTMRFKIDASTKRNEYTLTVLCGVILYRHIDRFQKMEVMSMIRNGKPNISLGDISELVDFCTDMSVQYRWWLWALTTEELNSKLKDEVALQKIFNLVGLSPSIAALTDAAKEANNAMKHPKGSVERKNGFKGVGWRVGIALLAGGLQYINDKQLSNSMEEIDKRTSNPKSSTYY